LATSESSTNRRLSIRVNGSGENARVSLTGRVTVDSSPALRDQLLAILDRKSLSTLTIDLEEVSYIDLSGIATLVEALKIARTRKTTLQLRGLHDRPRYLLEVSGLLGLFETNGRSNGASESKVH